MSITVRACTLDRNSRTSTPVFPLAAEEPGCTVATHDGPVTILNPAFNPAAAVTLSNANARDVLVTLGLERHETDRGFVIPICEAADLARAWLETAGHTLSAPIDSITIRPATGATWTHCGRRPATSTSASRPSSRLPWSVAPWVQPTSPPSDCLNRPHRRRRPTRRRHPEETRMPDYMLINRTRVARFVGAFPDRDSAIAALKLPADGVARRDPELDNEPQLWLSVAHPDLPLDGNQHWLGDEDT
ncbi:MAG: hypothetical protein EA356_00670 [Geminicoccaceae bacterium]|nr:MAG: hypothetical protein EA356_00670 [Geminicoccaceae bacterium]